MEKYLMKYDVDGQLYLYLERDKLSGKVDSFIKLIDKRKLLRYDGRSKERTFTKFNCECIIVHKFQASESWVTVIKDGCNISEQYEFPKRKALFSFRNNSITLFTISTHLTHRCTSVLGVPNKKKNKQPYVKISPSLSNSKLFMNAIIAKITKNVK